MGWGKWLLHHYLFFRIPLVRPDRLLGRTARWIEWLGGRRFALASVLALMVGLAMLAQNWDRLAATFLDTVSLPGALAYGIALGLAKVTHELAHAYTAKAKGCRVPTMGVAFLVLWPVLYTDVNESWLLPRRRDRLAVSAAGILAELTLAAWATLAWGLLADGALRQAMFVLATVTWVSSLVMNLSPFMRFDGYFLLMDGLDMPNLHARSFAMARWWLREALFDLGEEAPEPLSPATRRWLVAFAALVWIYRLVVFLGIAALVYQIFIKVVGIGLFVVEIGWFVVLPIWSELGQWRQRGPLLLARRRGRISLILAGLGLMAALLPWQSGVSAPAILQAADHRPLYPVAPARTIEVAVAEGQRVDRGQVLFRLSSPDLDHRAAQASRRIEALEHDLAGSGFDAGLQARTQSLTEELRAATAERRAARTEAERLTIAAPLSGTVADLMPDLAPGQWLSPKDRLASILGDGPAEITAYVAEDAVDRVEVGAPARFVPAAPGRPATAATVTAIERTALRRLDAASLSSVAGGPIAVRPGDRSLTPERALYRVRLTTLLPAPTQELTGTVHIDTAAASPLAGIWRSAVAALVKEAGM